MWPGSPRSKWAELLSKLFKGLLHCFPSWCYCLQRGCNQHCHPPHQNHHHIQSSSPFFVIKDYFPDDFFLSNMRLIIHFHATLVPTEIKFLILFSAAAHENSTQPAVGMKNVKRITTSFLEVAPRRFVRGWRLF